MYASGVRAFVQLGVGSLASFVGDTLRGKEHLAIAAASDKHAGLAQLARVRAALYVDGFVARARRCRVEPSRPQAAARARRAAGDARRQRAAARDRRPKRPDAGGDPCSPRCSRRSTRPHSRAAPSSKRIARATKPRRRASSSTRDRRTLGGRERSVPARSLLLSPAAGLADRRRSLPGRADDDDARHDDRRGARAAAGAGRRSRSRTSARCAGWPSSPPVEIEIRAKVDGRSIDVEIPGYARATVRLAAQLSGAAATEARAARASLAPAPHSAAEMYEHRWMFHGPGVSRRRRARSGRQRWRRRCDRDAARAGRAARLRRPADGLVGDAHRDARSARDAGARRARRAVRATSRRRRARRVQRAHARRRREGRARRSRVASTVDRVWARITGWTDRRFDSDDAVWRVLMYPETNALGVPRRGRRRHADRALDRRGIARADDAALPDRARARRATTRSGRARDAAGCSAAWPRKTPCGSTTGTAASGSSGRPRSACRTTREAAQPIVDGPSSRVDRAQGRHRGRARRRAWRGRRRHREDRAASPSRSSAVAFTERERCARRRAMNCYARVWAAKEAVAKARGTGHDRTRRRSRSGRVDGERA